MKNSCVAIVSDFHAPYNHPDAVKFLTEVKKVFQPDLVLCTGDEIDYHSMSFHDSDPDLDSAGKELTKAIKALKPLYELFPEMVLVESNHGSMVYRKGKHHGIPRAVLRSYSDILEAPKGWKWVSEHYFTTSDGGRWLLTHGMSATSGKLSRMLGVSTVEGHYHTKLEAMSYNTQEGLRYACKAGCLIDDKSMAFAYNKHTPERPALGIIVILDGVPQIVPMRLTPKGRWIGKL